MTTKPEIIQREHNIEVGKAIVGQGFSRPVAEMYSLRINDAPLAIDTLNATTALLNDYQSIVDLTKGAKIFAEALNEGTTVAGVLDFDGDGCSCAAVLSRFAKETGWFNRLRIVTPERLTQGYGASPEIVEDAVMGGAEFIITGDNGIMAFAAAKKAKELGVKYLVTDHHLPEKKDGKDVLPEADAIVNPAREDCQWQGGILCGASVLYIFLLEVAKYMRPVRGMNPDGCDMQRLLQVLAFATVVDCVPLVGANRAILNAGLDEMRNVPYPSFKAYMDHKKVEPHLLDEEFFKFSMGPLINAAGRLGPAAPAVDFLCTEDTGEIDELIQLLENNNDERKGIQEQVLQEAIVECESLLSGNPDLKVLVVGNESWHHGVVGIVAGRLAEQFRRPAFVLGGSHQDKTLLKGSGRSGDTPLHLKNLLDEVYPYVSDALLGYGGHSAAAGLTLTGAALQVFADQINISAESVPAPYHVDHIYHNHVKDPKRVFEWLNAGPFGQGFENPSIALINPKIEQMKIAKSDTALFSIGGIKCVGFRIGKKLNDHGNKPITFILNPCLNHFRGNTSYQFIVKAAIFPKYRVG